MVYTKAGNFLASFIFFMGLQSIAVAQSAETTVTEALATSSQIIENTTTATSVAEAVVTTSTASEFTTPRLSPKNEATSVSLPGGVVYQIIKPGTGAEAQSTGTRLIHYTLKLAGQDKIVESSRDVDIPVPFTFASGESQAIEGMEAGTTGMHVGEIRAIYVPAEQGYGDEEHGSIPGGSDLLFEVELVDIK